MNEPNDRGREAGIEPHDHDDEREILEQLGYGLTDDDRYLLAVTTPDQRSTIFTRLRALSELAAGRLDVDKASKMAGTSPATFYRLRKAWFDGKTGLRSVSGYAGRRPRGVGTGQKLSSAKAAAQTLIENDLLSDMPVKTLARLVRKATGDEVSLNAAEAMIRTLRLERTRVPSEFEESYGRDLLLDSCAVSLKIRDEDDVRAGLAILATVMEVSTGLILAAVPAREHDAVQAQLRALYDANSALKRYDADVKHPEPTSLVAVVAPSTDPCFASFVRTLRTNLGDKNVKASGPRRFGRSTIAVIGRRLGRLRFLPNSTQGGSVDAAVARSSGRRPLNLEEASLIVMQSLEEHNEIILDRLRAEKLIGAPTRYNGSSGRMIEAIEKALAGLS